MRFSFPTIGIVFETDGELEQPYDAVKMFMKNTDPKRLTGCTIMIGDVSSRYFCVAVSGATLDLGYLKEVFGKINHSGLAPHDQRFIEKPAIERLALIELGWVDSHGRLVTEEWIRVEHDQCKETGWGYNPQVVSYELSESLKAELEIMRRPKSP